MRARRDRVYIQGLDERKQRCVMDAYANVYICMPWSNPHIPQSARKGEGTARPARKGRVVVMYAWQKMDKGMRDDAERKGMIMPKVMLAMLTGEACGIGRCRFQDQTLGRTPDEWFTYV